MKNEGHKVTVSWSRTPTPKPVWQCFTTCGEHTSMIIGEDLVEIVGKAVVEVIGKAGGPVEQDLTPTTHETGS